MMKKQKDRQKFITSSSVYVHESQNQPEQTKKYSRQYYKLLHTLRTLQTGKQPISIHQCMTPLIFKNLFNPKQQRIKNYSHNTETQKHNKIQMEPHCKAYIQKCQKQTRIKLGKQNVQAQQDEKKNNNQTSEGSKQNTHEDEDDGFQIGQKEENEDVVQFSKRYLGSLITGFIPKKK